MDVTEGTHGAQLKNRAEIIDFLYIASMKKLFIFLECAAYIVSPVCHRYSEYSPDCDNRACDTVHYTVQ